MAATRFTGCAMALSFFLVAAPAAAADWTFTDSALLGGALTTIAIDWGQTRTIAASPERFQEVGNKFCLGSQPSVGRVNLYFAGYALTTIGVALVLPPEWRKLYLGGIIFYQAALIYQNDRIGIRMSF